MKKNKRRLILQTIREHVANNKKEYVIVSILFVIGIFLGVFFINNVGQEPKTLITEYLNQFIQKLKSIEDLNLIELLKTSIGQNIMLAIGLWFFGTTIIGIPVVFGIVAYRGFCLGYTIAACISIMGISKGIIFVLILLLLQNLLVIPAILALAVSGIKLYKSIMRDKTKENVKVEMLRHTVFSLIMLMILIISSVIEIFVSTNILKLWIVNPFLDNFYKDTFLYSIGVK